MKAPFCNQLPSLRNCLRLSLSLSHRIGSLPVQLATAAPNRSKLLRDSCHVGYIPVASHCNRYGVAPAAPRRFRTRPRAPGSLRGDARHPHRVLLRSASCVAGSRGALLQPLDPPHHV